MNAKSALKKEGETIVVPMGMYLPHAVKIEKVRTDEEGQIIGEGVAVEMEGCNKNAAHTLPPHPWRFQAERKNIR